MVEQIFNHWFQFQITELNPESLHSAYDVKAYVLLIAMHPTDGNVKSGGPLKFHDLFTPPPSLSQVVTFLRPPT